MGGIQGGIGGGQYQQGYGVIVLGGDMVVVVGVMVWWWCGGGLLWIVLWFVYVGGGFEFSLLGGGVDVVWVLEGDVQ